VLNLRYHLVSIVAIFLALGLGVVAGATVVDRGTVSFLQDRVDEVEEAVARTEEANAALRAELDRAREREVALAEEASSRLVPGLLDGVPVIVVRLPGGDTATDDALRSTLSASGAVVDPIVTLGEDLRLDDEETRRRLAEALGLPEGLIDRPDSMARVAARRLAAALWPPAYQPSSLPEEEREAGAARDLAILTESGFLTVERGPDAPAPDTGVPPPAEPTADIPPSVGPAVGFVLVTSPDRELTTDARLVIDLLATVARSSPAPNIVVATMGDGSDPPVSLLREEEPAVANVATVDDAFSFAGRLAIILALRDGPEAGGVGHFGSGPGAQRLIPAAPA
jgi:hypothetical protein